MQNNHPQRPGEVCVDLNAAVGSLRQASVRFLLRVLILLCLCIDPADLGFDYTAAEADSQFAKAPKTPAVE